MLRNSQRIFATAALVIASSAYAANAPPTVGDVIDRQATTQRAEKNRVLPAFTIPNEDNEIPSVASMAGIGTALTVKFSIRDGVVSVSEPGGQINNNWVFLRRGEGLSVFVQNISNKKTYRVTMKIPDDQEFGQKDKVLSTPMEMTMPPMPMQ